MAAAYSYGSAPTYTKIATITATGSVSDYSFTNIPQTFTDLVVVAQVRGAKAATTCSLLAYVGTGDNGTSLLQSNENSVTYITGDGSSATSTRTTSASGLTLVSAPAASATSGVFGNYILNFLNYTNSTTFKTVLMRADLATTATRAFLGLATTTSPLKTVGIATYGDSNIASGSTLTLYGIKAAQVPKAEGGDIRTDGTYWYHQFRNTSAFSTKTDITADVLTVAGGGGGGSYRGGGGGAGGLVYSASQSLSGRYVVTVGAGGFAGIGNIGFAAGLPGGKGGNSRFGALTEAIGGGRGPAAVGGTNGEGAGTGNGGSGCGVSSASQTPGLGTSGQGNNGGAGWSGYSGKYGAGGGGGAGAVGSAGTSTAGGAGGAGLLYFGQYYAGGGGGGNYGGGTSGAGGSSIGGAGGSNSNGSAGSISTGSGGGGAGSVDDSTTNNGGTGGSGIVIVRYAV
jgi:hypothetical protein